LILIALGSNLPGRYGSSEAVIRAALVRLKDLGLDVRAVSRLWRTAPVPVSDQPWYVNAAVCVQTALAPEALMALLQGIEAEFGRVRSGLHNEARILDLDLLAYEGQVFERAGLVLPHPRLQERAFVLYPLLDIAPDWIHPVLGRSIAQMIEGLAEDFSNRPVALEKTAA
jgi:2-amino-4-hydroxy-6-hydroxymethyldihydropteridine diphosphokinase